MHHEDVLNMCQVMLLVLLGLLRMLELRICGQAVHWDLETTFLQHGLEDSLLLLQDFCRKVTAANIAVMASGGAPPTYRFYFHCQRADRETRILVESIVDKNMSAMQVTIKAEDSSSPEQFQRLYQTLLGSLQ